jgi:hypothetical protein
MKQEITTVQSVVFGPHMSALTEKQRLFVFLWNNGGHRNGAECCRKAGYSDSSGADRVAAHRLLSDPRIKAAIVEDVQSRLCGNLARWTEVIEGIADTPGPKQFDAARYLAAHSGLIERTRTEVDVTVTVMSYEQKVDRLRQLAANAGADPDAVLRELGIDPSAPVIDVEYVDVTDDDGTGIPDELKGLI